MLSMPWVWMVTWTCSHRNTSCALPVALRKYILSHVKDFHASNTCFVASQAKWRQPVWKRAVSAARLTRMRHALAIAPVFSGICKSRQVSYIAMDKLCLLIALIMFRQFVVPSCISVTIPCMSYLEWALCAVTGHWFVSVWIKLLFTFMTR